MQWGLGKDEYNDQTHFPILALEDLFSSVFHGQGQTATKHLGFPPDRAKWGHLCVFFSLGEGMGGNE